MRRGALFDTLADGDGPLGEAQAALVAAREAWRGDPRCAASIEALTQYGAGVALNPLGDSAAAGELVAAFFDHMLPALAAHPLGQFPLRHGGDCGVRTLLLAHEGRAFLSLVAREPGDYPSRVVSFREGERHEILLAGSGSGRLVRRRAGALEYECRPLVAGTDFTLDLACETLLVDTVDARLVSLLLVRTAECPGPVREYALDSGELLHQSAGDAQESRVELALALLGRMGRTDAAPLMAEVAAEGSDHLRWQALRECIALDTAAGFTALQQVATDSADSLNAPAVALRDRLCAAHPALAAFEPA